MIKLSKETALFGLVHGGMPFVEDLKKELAEWSGYSYPLNNQKDADKWNNGMGLVGPERFWNNRISYYQTNLRHDRKYDII